MSEDSLKHDATADPRIHFAAERTLLAWLRTGLAMMGFGFVVARFGVFLRELSAARSGPPMAEPGLSIWVGIALVVLGVVVNVSAAVKHCRTIRRLEKGQRLKFSPLSLGTVIAFLLAILGLWMAFYLLSRGNSA